jgi:putative ATP-dependent endonuclease of OLD family
MAANHPLSGIGITACNFKCFGENEAGFEEFQPINIIIGRNNSGKSALLDVLDLCIAQGKIFNQQLHSHQNSTFEVRISQALDERTLQQVFPSNSRGGGVPGRTHWEYGTKFVGSRIVRKYEAPWAAGFFDGPNFPELPPQAKTQAINNIITQLTYPFTDVLLLRIAAERDVQPEASDVNRRLKPNGNGVTNIVRAFINSDDLPRHEVELNLLNDLNIVYRGDSKFLGIICQENEGINQWEIFLREENKGDIRLSQSGSSLKSIFIILSMLRLYPILQRIKWKKTIFSIEEPENNLHPALLRRLLDFLAEEREKKGFTLIVTTHSPISIDWSTRREDSQIVHVQHDGVSATTRTAREYLHNKEIIEDLDIRASDLLQANGIIWVEGPSDRIYLKRWIDLVTGGKLKEGTHYTIMFYGGKLLSHLEAVPPDESDKLISLFSINRNGAIVIDSDRRLNGASGKGRPRSHLNATKRRIREEMERMSGFVWITEGKEIENYIPIDVLQKIFGKKIPKSVSKYTDIISQSFVGEYKNKKVDLAYTVAETMNEEDIGGHLDLQNQLNELASHIRQWNNFD